MTATSKRAARSFGWLKLGFATRGRWSYIVVRRDDGAAPFKLMGALNREVLSRVSPASLYYLSLLAIIMPLWALKKLVSMSVSFKVHAQSIQSIPLPIFLVFVLF